MTSGAGPARAGALRALRSIRQGLPINEALASAGELSAVDRALMAQLVYGVERHLRYLDAWIGQFQRGSLEPDVRDILRIGFFQVGFLDRIPQYAAVHAAVEQTKAIQPKASRLVNAVLRRGAAAPPPRFSDLGVQYSHPDWVVQRWMERFGPTVTEAMLAADQSVPPLTLRVNRLRSSREAVLGELETLGVAAEASPYLGEAIRVTGSLWLEGWPPFERGEVSVQDESGMLVAYVVDPKTGERVVDAAAGLGGKTTHVVERAGGALRVLAVDLSTKRLKLLEKNCIRLGVLPQVEGMAGNARTVLERYPGTFDRAIVDAPCTGLGVLRRRVDARWKKNAEDFVSLSTLQREILDAAIGAVKPGGVVVYSTCSIEPEETVDQVRAVLARWSSRVALESVAEFLPSPELRESVSGGMLTLLPGQHGMDGFFIARLRRR